MGCNDDVCDIFPENDYIYAITVMETIEERNRIPYFGDSRCIGFYFTYDDARDAVMNNYCDIWETIYDYAIIEKIAPGFYNGASSDDRSTFKYDKDKDSYVPIDEPKILKHIYGIGIG